MRKGEGTKKAEEKGTIERERENCQIEDNKPQREAEKGICRKREGEGERGGRIERERANEREKIHEPEEGRDAAFASFSYDEEKERRRGRRPEEKADEDGERDERRRNSL